MKRISVFVLSIILITSLGSSNSSNNDNSAFPHHDLFMQRQALKRQSWYILAPIPEATSGHSESTIHDGTYMVSGFHPSGSYPNTIYHYIIATDTWITGNSNPYGCGAYGMAYGAAGKHYRFGGTDGWPIALDRVDIYDPDSGWSAGAAMPIPNMDMIGGVYKDSLIYMLGGGNWGGNVNPHTDVYFYDIFEDTWTQATSFPGQGRGCLAGGVFSGLGTDDYYAVVACGYDGTSNYLADYIVGSIDPANPANITWGSPTAIPYGFEGRYRAASNVWLCGWPLGNELMVICGQGISTPFLDDVWSYEPISDTWFNWYSPKTYAISNVNSIAITEGSIFVVGGYTGSYVDYHECMNFEAIEEIMHQQVSPLAFGFALNTKNPVSGNTGITYITIKTGNVSVKIYDNAGRLVKTLVSHINEPAGTKTVYWNAKDDNQRTVANGVYFVKLEAENKTDTYKMILVK